MLQPFPAVLDRFPAHLHVDVLPEFQRKGYGRSLVRRFLEEVKKEGAVGVHLDMVRANEGARLFYEKEGFGRCEEVLDGGESGEKGVCGIVATLVKTL